MSNKTYLSRLKKELKNLPGDNIILLKISSDNIFELNNTLIKLFFNNGENKIVISANRPYSNLINIYKKNNINLKKIFIIDCISKNLNGEVPGNNVVFMENLSALTDIALAINERIKKTPGNNKFVFFDSLTTMLIHNKPYIFARFVHNVLTKMRLKGVGGILVSLEDQTNKEITAEIAQLCDKMIKI
jgi:hypothetical protein